MESINIEDFVTYIYSRKIYKIPYDILIELENIIQDINYINSKFYYGNINTPFLVKGEMIYTIDNEFIINSKNDIINYINHGGSVYINDNFRLDINNIGHTFLGIKDVNAGDKIITPLLNEMLIYIESSYMINVHPENNDVISDVFNISNSISLVDSSAFIYDNFVEYLGTIFDEHFSYNVSSVLNILYNKLYNFIINNIDESSINTIKIRLQGNNNILLSELPPPSSIRYNLNKEFIKDKNEHIERFTPYSRTGDFKYKIKNK